MLAGLVMADDPGDVTPEEVAASALAWFAEDTAASLVQLADH